MWGSCSLPVLAAERLPSYRYDSHMSEKKIDLELLVSYSTMLLQRSSSVFTPLHESAVSVKVTANGDYRAGTNCVQLVLRLVFFCGTICCLLPFGWENCGLGIVTRKIESTDGHM